MYRIIFQCKTGAIIKATIKLRRGDNLNIAVGQKGGDPTSGSGGTFVVKQNSDGTFKPLVIAGGAGGDSNDEDEPLNSPCCNAQPDNEYGNGSKPGEFNIDIGSSGKTDLS